MTLKYLSRKEALEILNGMKVKIKIPKAAVMQNKRNAALDMAIEALKYSEIPNSSTDCISRRAAIDAMGKAKWAKERLMELPSAQPEVLACGEGELIAQPEIIRCKDCKHRDKYGCCKYWKGLAMGDIPIATDDYDFCSYAEQKGEQCERKL